MGVDFGQPDPHWWITDVDHEVNFTPRPAVAASYASFASDGDVSQASRKAGQWVSLTNPSDAPGGVT